MTEDDIFCVFSRLTWRKHLCDLIRDQARSWGKGESLGGRGNDFFAHYLVQEIFRIHQEDACYETKEFGSALHVTGRDQIIILSLKQSAWTVPVPVLKNSGMHFLPPGAAAVSRERENSSQHSKNLLTGLTKQRDSSSLW